MEKEQKILLNNDKLWDCFNGSDDIIAIVEAIYNRIDEDEVEDETWLQDAIIDALNDEIIYYSQQWTILEFYCLPSEANWNEAIEEFVGDLLTCIEWNPLYN